MSLYFWKHWNVISRKISAKKKKMIFLDFDGTLAPISRDPEAVRINPNIKSLLRALSRRPSCRIVIISGRSLSDVRRRVGLKNVIYVGNHGFEISGRGCVLPAQLKKAQKEIDAVQTLSRRMSSYFQFWPGVGVENKTFTLSLHFRNLKKANQPVFNEVVKYLKEDSRALPVVWRLGKKVWEVRPKRSWGKGETALHLYKLFPGSLPIVLGDDKTDEDMFRALNPRGITVRVRHLKNTKAKYYFKSMKGVIKFLEKLEAFQK